MREAVQEEEVAVVVVVVVVVVVPPEDEQPGVVALSPGFADLVMGPSQ